MLTQVDVFGRASRPHVAAVRAEPFAVGTSAGEPYPRSTALPVGDAGVLVSIAEGVASAEGELLRVARAIVDGEGASSPHVSEVRDGAELGALSIRRTTARVAELGRAAVYLVRDGSILRPTGVRGSAGSGWLGLATLALRPRDAFLLCSGSVNALVDEVEVWSLLLSARCPAEACATLLNLAWRRGNSANATVLVAEVSPCALPTLAKARSRLEPRGAAWSERDTCTYRRRPATPARLGEEGASSGAAPFRARARRRTSR